MQKKAKTTATGTLLISVLKLSLFIFGLIFVPLLSSAQTECPESTPPKFDPEHEPRTLCQKYSPPGKFPNRFGTSETHYASQIIWNQNNGSDIFTGDIDLVGELIIDQDFTLLNCKVRIWPNVRIRVEADVIFTLDGSKLFCCQDMWQGIDLDYRSTVVSLHVTEIEDAMVAMESPCTATMSIRNTIFNRNTVGIRLGYDGPVPFDPCPTFPVFTQFAGNLFQCNAPLNGTTNGVSLVGVQVFKTNATIGALTSALDTFRNIQFGIRFESQWWGTSVVNRCRFEGVLNDGIYLAQGDLTVNRCQFLNCGYRGINAVTTRGLTVQYSNFNLNDDVAAQLNDTNIYRHIRAAEFALDCNVNINRNFFGCNFTNAAKDENMHAIDLIGSPTMGGGTDFLIEWNDFNIIVDQVTYLGYSTGILLRGEFPTSSSSILQFNNFFVEHPTFQPGDYFLYGITLRDGNKNNVEIYTNRFDSDSWGPFAVAGPEMGIWLDGSMGHGNEVTGNIFEANPATGFSNNYYFGVFPVDFLNTVFCENMLRECEGLMYFKGICMGTQYYGNTHIGGHEALYIQEGYIGEQGTEGGAHFGNKWYDKWLNVIPNHHAYCTPPNLATQSRIWVSDPQSVRNTQGLGYTYFSEYHPADIDPDQDDEWFKHDSTGTIGTTDCVDHIIMSSETDKEIAEGTIEALVQNTTQIWTGKRYLYAKLRQNPDLLDDYAEFVPFLVAEAQTSVGQLYNVEQKIKEALEVPSSIEAQLDQIQNSADQSKEVLFVLDSVLDMSSNTVELTAALEQKLTVLAAVRTQDSLYATLHDGYRTGMLLKLQEALVLNNQVNASTVYEQNEKTVNDIALSSRIFQGNILTATQLAVLKDIAVQCPKIGGHGVYRARGMLSSDCDAEDWDDNNTGCYPLPELAPGQMLENRFSKRPVDLQDDRLIVYPNPAVEGFFVKLPANQCGVVTLTDGLGKTWKELEANAGIEVLYVELGHVPHGVYFCTFTSTSGERQIGKVFVTGK